MVDGRSSPNDDLHFTVKEIEDRKNCISIKKMCSHGDERRQRSTGCAGNVSRCRLVPFCFCWQRATNTFFAKIIDKTSTTSTRWDSELFFITSAMAHIVRLERDCSNRFFYNILVVNRREAPKEYAHKFSIFLPFLLSIFRSFFPSISLPHIYSSLSISFFSRLI